VWLTAFRAVATTLLLVAIAIRLLARPPQAGLSAEDSLSFVVIGFVYVLTLIYGLVLRRGRAGLAAAYLQILGDLLVATSVVYLTGGTDSPFAFTYSVAVIAAAILLGQRGALIVAAVGSVAFALQALLIQQGVLRPPLGSEPLPPLRLAYQLLSTAMAQMLIAALAAYLSRQLSQAGGRLSQSQEQIRELATLQRQILTSMPSGLITCDASGAITFANHAAEQILGLGGRAGVVWHMDALLPGALQLAASSSRRHELTVDTPQGRKILGLSVTPLEGSGGAMLILFQDLTELRRMEDELRRADRLAALGSMAAQLAHEIRNPLASMRGSAQMLSQDAPADPAARRLANILVRESDRLSSLLEDFLKFARPPPPSLQTVSLDHLVGETVEMVRADPLSRGVELEVRAEPVRSAVDAGQFRQVLLNLLRNAMEAAQGGKVRVQVESAPEGPRIRVWDSGGSIPPQDLERVFEPFFTTRDHGTGLGLSTAHSIVSAHGGKISVSSAPASGTEFVVQLPGTAGQEATAA
jgi:two-component system sensor histidine kinase PilS (NtrC family)